MRINNNISALNTFRQLTNNTGAVNKSMEKLSSGLRINRAGDDAAGLAISEKMRAQIRGTEMASKNSQDAISLVQTAEGALTETHAILQRMNELAVQASSDTNEDTDRAALQAEFSQLKSDIANETSFNNKKLLDGSVGSVVDTNTTNSDIFLVAGVTDVKAGGSTGTTYEFADTGSALTITRTDGVTGAIDTTTIATTADGSGTISVSDWGLSVELGPGYTAAGVDGTQITMGASSGLTVQTGANSGETMTISIDSMKSADLGLTASAVNSLTDAQAAVTAVGTAINTVSTQRANLGAVQNRLEHKINNLNTSSENLTAAESRIRDVDMASEMVEFTKNNILVQASQAMLAQANAQPQGVLQLLQ